MPNNDPRIIATTSRMPFAVDEIHKLGEAGRYVLATDTFSWSPGNHSRGAAARAVTPPPTQESTAFVDEIIRLVGEHEINWLLPMFEEVFYLAANRDKLAAAHPNLKLFFPDYDTLSLVHDKVTFADLCRQLDLPVAESITATSQNELQAAIGNWEHWFARAAYGRGGLDVATNTGPLAGEADLNAIEPTPENPWLVQEYLKGVDRCSWSVAHEGEIVLHSCYEHPLAIDDRGGIVFQSVDSPESLAAAQKIAKELNWTGQISFDYLMTEDGVHHMVECNARPTAGCSIATTEEFDTALFAPSGLVTVPAGRKRSIKSAILRDVLRHPSRFKTDFAAAKGGADVYGPSHDHLPLLYSVLSLQHVLSYRKAHGVARHKGEQLVATQFYDVLYDGAEIPA